MFHQNTALSASQPGEVPVRGLGWWNCSVHRGDIQFRPLSKNRQQWLIIDWVEHKRDMQICERFVALLCLEPIQKTLEGTRSHTERVGGETPCKWKVKKMWPVLGGNVPFPVDLLFPSPLSNLSSFTEKKNVDFFFFPITWQTISMATSNFLRVGRKLLVMFSFPRQFDTT